MSSLLSSLGSLLKPRPYSTTPQMKETIASLWRLEKIILDTLNFNEVVEKIVTSILTELGYLRLGYRIVVLALVDKEKGVLKRISYSQTTEAKIALENVHLPFKDIEIPLSAKNNLNIKVLESKQPAITTDWSEYLSPPFTPEEAIAAQRAAGIKTSFIFPVVLKGDAMGILIFSLVKEEKEVSSAERDLIQGYTDIVGLAIQNAQLYTSLGQKKVELEKGNQQMYKQNLELTIRNKTLSILRKMYEIMNTSFGLAETCQRLAQAIADQLKFTSVSIAIIDKSDQLLKGIATYPIRHTAYQDVIFMGIPMKRYTLSLNHTHNYAVNAVINRQTRMTNFLYDILTPFVTEEQAMTIQQELKIQTTILYPILFAQDTLGVMILGLDKHIGDLSRSERETLRELIGVIAIAIERAQIFADLQDANEKLLQMDKLKDEFVSITSHELRTPMTAIRSYLWMVLHDRGGPLDPKAREYLTRVSVSTDRLINLVNDMLDVSRIESGRVQLKIETVDMVQLAKDVQSEFQARVAERAISLQVISGADIPQALADKEKTHQVLENLVGNAVKFTANGGSITIGVNSTDGMVTTSVTDTGKGISQEDIKRLFTKFGRLDNSLVSISESGGTGLGLYICKQYVTMQKGEIHVESEVGKGTTFTFTLPRG